VKYGYRCYPATNGLHHTAMMCDKITGRHFIMMPHIERLTFNGIGRIIQKIAMTKYLWYEAQQERNGLTKIIFGN
jgi:hypothetical protein